MSITWTVSHPLRLVVATGKGEVTAADILFYVDEIGKAGAISYRAIGALRRRRGVRRLRQASQGL